VTFFCRRLLFQEIRCSEQLILEHLRAETERIAEDLIELFQFAFLKMRALHRNRLTLPRFALNEF